VATDAKPIEDLVNAVYGAPGSKVKVLTTPYQPKHSGNAGSKFERLKLAMDWQLLAMADQLVSVGPQRGHARRGRCSFSPALPVGHLLPGGGAAPVDHLRRDPGSTPACSATTTRRWRS
jgi:hypothetical protein